MAYPTLKLGSRGEYVKTIQGKVGVAIDGIYGRQTEQAVRSFQSRKGLKVDGIVGPQTWNAILNTGSAPTTGGGSMPATIPGSSPGVPTTLIDKVLGVFILYGLFKVLQKAL